MTDELESYYLHDGKMIRSDCTGEWIKKSDAEHAIEKAYRDGYEKGQGVGFKRHAEEWFKRKLNEKTTKNS